ncbi:hypothetical protein KUTeg_011929 [Tegillarca granosa]|uniref:Uncharacterized protein n=1 Tax=Tegillarca granosa TaxID=220873 RepID=A0ABQ9EYA7_TEGGR|nr:hypothetical protein KUTeg_011929 [Tegillarca granosa]
MTTYDIPNQKGKTAVDGSCGHQTTVNMETPTPPDGGWGWVVVFGCFLQYVIEAGLKSSYGVLYVDIMDNLNVDEVDVSWIGSIRSGLYLGIAPLVLLLTKTVSCRVFTISGSIIIFSSLIVSAYLTSLPALIICLGVFQGIGFGFTFVTSNLVVNQYFDKKRPIAFGIAMCGGAVGTTIYPVLQDFILKEFGLSNALLLNAAPDLVFQSWIRRTNKQRGKAKDESDELGRTSSSSHRNRTSSSNLGIFKDPLFVAFFLTTLVITIGEFIPLYFLPNIVVNKGYDLSKASIVLSIQGLTSGFGRVLIGACSYRIPRLRAHLHNILAVFSGVLISILPFCNNYGQIVFLSAVYGFTLGGVLCLANVLIVDLFDRTVLASSLGYITLASGIGAFIGSPIAAGLSEVIGSDDVIQTMAYYKTIKENNDQHYTAIHVMNHLLQLIRSNLVAMDATVTRQKELHF